MHMGGDKTTKCMKCDNIDCNRRLPVQNVTFDQILFFSAATGYICV